MSILEAALRPETENWVPKKGKKTTSENCDVDFVCSRAQKLKVKMACVIHFWKGTS